MYGATTFLCQCPSHCRFKYIGCVVNNNTIYCTTFVYYPATFVFHCL